MVYRRLSHLMPLPAKASAEFRSDISLSNAYTFLTAFNIFQIPFFNTIWNSISYTIAGSLKYDVVNNNVHHSHWGMDKSQVKVRDHKDHKILQISHWNTYIFGLWSSSKPKHCVPYLGKYVKYELSNEKSMRESDIKILHIKESKEHPDYHPYAS